jgi:hypothetical protein
MSVFTQTISRPKLQSSVLHLFFSEGYNNEAVTIPANSQVNSSKLFDIGTILGQITVGAATAAAKSGGNTGGGALTLDGSTPVLAGAMPGVYTARCTVAAAVIGTHSGLFEVRDPNGRVLGEVQVGGTFADQVKFAIAYATADFVVGDGFDITVAAGSGKYVAHDEAALDGSQVAAAVVLNAVTVSASADTYAVSGVRGPMVLFGDNLVWKTGISAAGQAAAIARLAGLGIIVRFS